MIFYEGASMSCVLSEMSMPPVLIASQPHSLIKGNKRSDVSVLHLNSPFVVRFPLP